MKKNIIILFAIIFLIYSFVYLIKIAFAKHIKIEFSTLRPFHYIVPVYYNGVKVGKVLSRNYSKDFSSAIVTIVVYPRNLKLPEGTVAYLKKHKLLSFVKTDYIDLIFPQEQTAKYISNNSSIKGVATVDINEYGSNQNVDEIEKIKKDLAESAENLNYAIQGISALFVTMNDIMIENKESFKNAAKNISQATNNFSSVTNKFDNSINQDGLNSTFNSFYSFADDLASVSSSLHSNMNSVNDTMTNVQEAAYETRIITKGIRQTLSKPFGGLRFFFGRTINNNSMP